jgi:hypothetical protein
MNDFFAAVGPFVYGVGIGYFAHPVWTIAKKIWNEAKQARKEW